jgi:hypothetical protein
MVGRHVQKRAATPSSISGRRDSRSNVGFLPQLLSGSCVLRCRAYLFLILILLLIESRRITQASPAPARPPVTESLVRSKPFPPGVCQAKCPDSAAGVASRCHQGPDSAKATDSSLALTSAANDKSQKPNPKPIQNDPRPKTKKCPGPTCMRPGRAPRQKAGHSALPGRSATTGRTQNHSELTKFS